MILSSCSPLTKRRDSTPSLPPSLLPSSRRPPSPSPIILLQRLVPVLAAVGLALVAAVVVVASFSSATPAVLLPAPVRVINGQKYVAVALPAGATPPEGAILAQPPHLSVKTTSYPVARAVAVNDGKYGTLAEKMVTQQHGQDAVPTGQFLKGSAPSVATLARAATYTPAQQKSLAKDFADAVNDCGRDGSDSCSHFLHPGGKSLRAFEKDQDQADSGLFKSYEQIQSMRSSSSMGSPRMPQLALTHMSFGSGGGVTKYGIPRTGSLPGDNV